MVGWVSDGGDAEMSLSKLFCTFFVSTFGFSKLGCAFYGFLFCFVMPKDNTKRIYVAILPDEEEDGLSRA